MAGTPTFAVPPALGLGRSDKVDPHRMIQPGTRSPVQREVWDWTLDKGVTILTAPDIHVSGDSASDDHAPGAA